MLIPYHKEKDHPCGAHVSKDGSRADTHMRLHLQGSGLQGSGLHAASAHLEAAGEDHGQGHKHADADCADPAMQS